MKEWQHHVLPPYLPEDLQTLQKILHLIQSVTPQNMLCVENFQATYSDGSWVAGYLKFLSFLLHKTIILPGKTISALKKERKKKREKRKTNPQNEISHHPKKKPISKKFLKTKFFSELQALMLNYNGLSVFSLKAIHILGVKHLIPIF